MNLSQLTRPPDLPAAGARIPGVSIRAFLAIVGAALSLVAFGSSGWFGVGVLISLIAAVAPEFLCAWLLIVFLAVGELGHHDGLRWQLLVLLAGVQLLHILGMLALELPWRSWIQPAVFVRPLRLLIAVQIPAQVLAAAAMLVFAPNAHGHRPLTIAAFSVLGAGALAGLALLLLRAGHDEGRGAMISSPRPEREM